MTRKRRALVLCDESARHPFRQSLPPHVRHEPVETERQLSWFEASLSDWRGFVAAYCTAFLVAMVFIT